MKFRQINHSPFIFLIVALFLWACATTSPEMWSPSPTAALLEQASPTWTASPIPPTASPAPSSTSPPSATPLPSATLPPSITPTPTISPTPTITPDLPTMLSALSPVLYGQGVSSAAAYDPGQPGPHPVVILADSGTIYSRWPDEIDWNEKLPHGWRPQTVGEVELVVIVDTEREINLGSASYNIGPDITRYRYETDIQLRVARTGQTLATYTFIGSDPAPFPETAPYDQTRLEGTHLVYPFLETWLCPNVIEQGCWTPLRTLEGQANHVIALNFSPDGQTLTWGAGYLSIMSVSRVSDGALLKQGQLDGPNFASMAFSPDGQTLATGTYERTVLLWRLSDGTLLNTLAGGDAGLGSVAFSPNGEMLAAGDGAGIVRLWRISDGSLLYTLEGHQWEVTTLTFSPDGQILASGGSDATVRLWQVSDGTLLRILEEPEAPPPLSSTITSLAFSPDGQILASGSYAVRLWQVSDGSLLRTMVGAEANSNSGTFFGVTSLAFSPDGQTLASGGGNATVRLWRISDGELMQSLEGNLDDNIVGGDYETHLAFSPDGQILAVSGGHGRVRLWQKP